MAFCTDLYFTYEEQISRPGATSEKVVKRNNTIDLCLYARQLSPDALAKEFQKIDSETPATNIS
jgi:hypothetical protein